MSVDFFRVTEHLILWNDEEEKAIIISILVEVMKSSVDTLHLWSVNAMCKARDISDGDSSRINHAFAACLSCFEHRLHCWSVNDWLGREQRSMMGVMNKLSDKSHKCSTLLNLKTLNDEWNMWSTNTVYSSVIFRHQKQNWKKISNPLALPLNTAAEIENEWWVGV